jgi:hypothetical protein
MQRLLNAVLLRHGRIWREGSKWTLAHRQWIGSQILDEPETVQEPVLGVVF